MCSYMCIYNVHLFISHLLLNVMLHCRLPTTATMPGSRDSFPALFKYIFTIKLSVFSVITAERPQMPGQLLCNRSQSNTSFSPHRIPVAPASFAFTTLLRLPLERIRSMKESHPDCVYKTKTKAKRREG